MNQITLYPKSEQTFLMIKDVLRRHKIEFEQSPDPLRIALSCAEVCLRQPPSAIF